MIQERINSDVWKKMKGELPCLESSKTCIEQLQSLAVQNSKALKDIDEKVEQINQKIAEAQKKNQRTTTFGLIQPIATDVLQKPNAVQSILGFILSPIALINKVLNTVGVPFLQNQYGGTPQVQNAAIAIGDLQIKVATIQQNRSTIAINLKDKILESVLAFDDSAREFQVSQELARRETDRLGLYTVAYRFGSYETSEYLLRKEKLDTVKGNTLRAWSKMRLQIEKIKILVLGQDDEE